MTLKAGSTFTAGPYKIDARPFNQHGKFHISNGDYVIATAMGQTPSCETEARAHAEFIAESFTVAHETGLTPRQLAEQRDELLAALHHAREAIEYGAPEFEATGEGGKLTLDIIDAAISKATDGGAL